MSVVHLDAIALVPAGAARGDCSSRSATGDRADEACEQELNVVVGALLVLGALLAAGFALWLRWLVRRPRDPSERGRDLG